MNKFKLSVLASLVLVGAAIGQAQAATSVALGPSAFADIKVEASKLTAHTLTAGGQLAAGQQDNDTSAATGHVASDETAALSVKWDEGQCLVDDSDMTVCTVSGTAVPTHKAKFKLVGTAGAALSAVADNPHWFGTSTQKSFDYVVMLEKGQDVIADTYKVVVDAGVVTP